MTNRRRQVAPDRRVPNPLVVEPKPVGSRQRDEREPPPEVEAVGATARDLSDFKPTFQAGVEVPDPVAPTAAPVSVLHERRPFAFTDGENLVPNGEFEDLDGSDTPVPFETLRGWIVPGNTIATQVDDEAHSGTYSLELRADNAGTLSISTHSPPSEDAIGVLEGWTYRAKAYVRAESTSRTMRLTVNFYDETHTDLEEPLYATVTDDSSDWRLLDTLPFRAPASAVHATLTVESVSSVADDEAHYLDDVELKAVSGMDGDTTVFSPGNVKSANFESGSAGWAINGDGDAEFNDVVVRGTVSGGGANLVPTNPGAEEVPTGDELLPNPGFEVDITGWVDGTNASLSRTTGTVRTGTGALLITATGPTPRFFVGGTGVNGLPVEGGVPYVFGGYVRAVSSAGEWQLSQLNFYDEAGDPVLAVDGNDWAVSEDNVTDSSSDWTALTPITFTAPPNAGYVQIGFLITGSANHLLDDATLTEGIRGLHTDPAPFYKDQGGSGDTIERTTSEFHDGAASWLVDTVPSRGFGTEVLPVTPNEPYKLSWWWQRGTANQIFALAAYYYDADGVPVDPAETELDGYKAAYGFQATNDWAQHSWTITPPDGAYQVVFTWIRVDSGGSDTVYVDDLHLERVPLFDGGLAAPDALMSRTDVFDMTGYLMPPGALVPWAGGVSLGGGDDVFTEGGEGGGASGEAIAGTPAGWIPCDGRAVSRSTWWRLFSVIGTTYGSGDGSTTFNVPDLRGRVPVGLDNIGGSDAGRLTASNTLGGSGGAELHNHPLSDAGQGALVVTGSEVRMRRVASSWTATHDLPGAGGIGTDTATSSFGAALRGNTDNENGMPPYVLVTYLIKG